MTLPRAAGLLLHPTSLPGGRGIGDLGPEAIRFLDWSASAGQRLWQVLPLGPTGHHSPYGGSSAFAGNPLLLSPERLIEEGLLPRSALDSTPSFPEDRVDFGLVERWKERLLRESWEFLTTKPPASLDADRERFRAAPGQSVWLADWTLYSALRARFGRPWFEWDRALAARHPDALASARRDLASEIDYAEYVQFLFWKQWSAVRAAARQRGIAILGDVPIYVAHDSADVWAHPKLFALDGAGRPELVAGVPPDYFSATGQLWGYPLYRWDRMAEEGYAWWIDRIRGSLERADAIRIDHFRGFAGYWAVPASEKTAVNGRWLRGPGIELFESIRAALPNLDVVAEDLGSITPDVRELIRALDFPGMKVLQFAFSEEDSEYLPHRHVPRCVVYTGTHDNDTTRGWFSALGKEDRERVTDYLGTSGERIEWDLIRAAYESVGERAIIPVQDVFGLGSEARMNTPGETRGNWTWRAREADFTSERAARLRRLAELSGRVSSGTGGRETGGRGAEGKADG